MQRHLERPDKRQSVPLSVASLLNDFLSQKPREATFQLPLHRIYPCVTEPQQDFNSSPDRRECDILGIMLDVLWSIQVEGTTQRFWKRKSLHYAAAKYFVEKCVLHQPSKSPIFVPSITLNVVHPPQPG